MEFIFNVLVVLHFLGLASLIGGFLVQMKATERVINPAMMHGALTQLVTGVAMVGMVSAMPDTFGEIDHIKIAVKTLVLIAILVLIFVFRKKTAIPTGVWGAIGGLSILNVIIAVFWH